MAARLANRFPGLSLHRSETLSRGVVQNRRFWVTRTRRNRPGEAGFRLAGCLVREAASLPGSGLLGLKRSEAQQRQPVRMALAGHQFARAFAVTLGAPAAHEAPMVQEELQQIQVRVHPGGGAA